MVTLQHLRCFWFCVSSLVGQWFNSSPNHSHRMYRRYLPFHSTIAVKHSTHRLDSQGVSSIVISTVVPISVSISKWYPYLNNVLFQNKLTIIVCPVNILKAHKYIIISYTRVQSMDRSGYIGNTADHHFTAGLSFQYRKSWSQKEKIFKEDRRRKTRKLETRKLETRKLETRNRD